MIIFKTLRYKNFLSTGNAFIELELNKYPNVCFAGKNGNGKSTPICALTFGLFGKAFRNINKGGLVNSVNGKNLEVEVTFDSNGKEYLIKRGIKPNNFEIYVNGKLLDQGAVKDYQDHLEKNILRMSYKSFTQSVVLGAASYTPFMQLSAADRRSVIEDLLDIQVFTTMNVLAKQKMQANKEAYEENRILLLSKEEKLAFVKKTVESLKTSNDDKFIELTNRLDTYYQERDEKKQLIETLANNLASIKIGNSSSLEKKRADTIALNSKMEYKISITKKSLSFFETNETCPTCTQKIEESFKSQHIKTLSDDLQRYREGSSRLSELLETYRKQLDEFRENEKVVLDIRSKITATQSYIKQIEQYSSSLEKEISLLNTSDVLYTEAVREQEELVSEIALLQEKRAGILDERQYLEMSLSLLKDGGIKTRIIKQYVPIINKTINKYLSMMNFFVDFNIDETFKETIKSRYRDEFAYANFSEGEKFRIDLAILLTWRYIAKMRNSISTNLLIFDEIMDSSLDQAGTDEFLKIMWEMENDNIIVITHKADQIGDRFHKVLTFEKHKGFTRIV